MSEWVLKLAERLIVGHKRDGRCVYDEQAKQELIRACGRPGISMVAGDNYLERSATTIVSG
jgi:transposase